jgi:3',5'-cyclic-AMP phosphodiesterase
VRCAWVTDVHLNFVDQERLIAFFDDVKRARPDVIFVTGDTGEAHDVFKFIELFALIAPTHAVLGNHDYYGSTIAALRASAPKEWLPPHAPLRLTDRTTLLGIDGWGDGRCGNLDSKVLLSDWREIGELDGLLFCPPAERCARLRAIGEAEAGLLAEQLARTDAQELIVLTHVPPFPDACWYEGKRSSPEWLPWFTCVAVGEVLLAHARAHPATTLTVLCGHTHGRGEYRATENLIVRTGGWEPGQRSYGNPIVQSTWEIA